MTTKPTSPSDQYPGKLSNKKLKIELDLFIKLLKEHDPVHGLLDILNYYEAMVNTGYLELQKREISKSSKWSIILGIITTIAALISIGLSIQATKLAQSATITDDKNRGYRNQVERNQSELLDKINQEINAIKISTDSLIRKHPTPTNIKMKGSR